ncbi:acetylxylan esterase [Streptomyces sp. NBC_01198]|uniref:acetylxylan esterase n=1 Tax=Streptomyces sp. NBC_01198 TaxID=2903769 RepID=UPI002E10A2CB
MALFDLTPDELLDYRVKPEIPPDFEEFWRRTLAEAAAFPLAARFTPYDTALPNVHAYDVRFAGWGGEPIAGWLLVPRTGQDADGGGNRCRASCSTSATAAGAAIRTTTRCGRRPASRCW